MWCTNWNDIPASDIVALSAALGRQLQRYNATLITQHPSFTMGAQAYENIDPEFQAEGCSAR